MNVMKDLYHYNINHLELVAHKLLFYVLNEMLLLGEYALFIIQDLPDTSSIFILNSTQHIGWSIALSLPFTYC